MNFIVSLDEFLTMVEPYTVTFLISLMVIFGGLAAFVDMATDLGIWLYRKCKKIVCKVKK